MVLMIDSMKEMQRKMTDGKEEAGMVKGVEIVRTGLPDLPMLPSWNPTTGPLQLGDSRMQLTPLEKIQHSHTTPSCLQDTKWQRLERRVSVMVL